MEFSLISRKRRNKLFVFPSDKAEQDDISTNLQEKDCFQLKEDDFQRNFYGKVFLTFAKFNQNMIS